MYESRKQPPLSRARFIRRLLLHMAGAVILIVVSLGVGIVGHIRLEGLSWHDSFLNTTMMLGGIGPVTLPQTDEGKLFVAFYGLYIGLVFAVAISLILAPVLHRLLHKFHWDDQVK